MLPEMRDLTQKHENFDATVESLYVLFFLPKILHRDWIFSHSHRQGRNGTVYPSHIMYIIVFCRMSVCISSNLTHKCPISAHALEFYLLTKAVDKLRFSLQVVNNNETVDFGEIYRELSSENIYVNPVSSIMLFWIWKYLWYDKIIVLK